MKNENEKTQEVLASFTSEELLNVLSSRGDICVLGMIITRDNLCCWFDQYGIENTRENIDKFFESVGLEEDCCDYEQINEAMEQIFEDAGFIIDPQSNLID